MVSNSVNHWWEGGGEERVSLATESWARRKWERATTDAPSICTYDVLPRWDKMHWNASVIFHNDDVCAGKLEEILFDPCKSSQIVIPGGAILTDETVLD